jgi:hypothetical protein
MLDPRGLGIERNLSISGNQIQRATGCGETKTSQFKKRHNPERKTLKGLE